MAEMTKNQLIADVAYDVLQELAPKELYLFKARSSAYFRDPVNGLKRKGAKDEMLGFGIELADPILTPAILAGVAAVVNFAIDAVKEPFKDGMKEVLKDGVTGMFEKKQPAPEAKEAKIEETPVTTVKPNTFTPEQLKKIRKQTIEQAINLGLPESMAEILADAILGRLAITK